MAGHHFISYSRADGENFALWLYDKLIGGPKRYNTWMDRYDISPGMKWDDELVKALKNCDSLLFVMTKDSVSNQSRCKSEWTKALRYKKPIVPLLIDKKVEKPFSLENHQHIDFSVDWEVGLARLRDFLDSIGTPEGKLRQLNICLEDANYELQRSKDVYQKQRLQNYITVLEEQITEQRNIIESLEVTKSVGKMNNTGGLENERKPSRIDAGENQTKYINRPPGLAPHFQERYVETKIVADFLRTPAKRMITIVGRGGIGKTALVCRLLKAIESGKLPDDLGDFSLDGIVYISEQTSRKITFANIYYSLCQLLPLVQADNLDQHYKSLRISTGDKMSILLEAFADRQIALLLDSFEDKVTADGEQLNDSELEEALQAILNAADHQLKVLITTRRCAKQLLLVQPGRQSRLDLNEGLSSPHAENLLRKIDSSGQLGLRDAEAALLYSASQLTRGYPRALEALAGILSADRDSNLEDLVGNKDVALPENVIKELVGEAFSRLDESSQKVIQALAVYGRPVTPSAVDFMLKPFITDIKSAPILKRLVNMHFVYGEAGTYYLHQIDREYAFSLVEEGNSDYRLPENRIFCRYILNRLGAAFFRKNRKPPYSWQTIDDLDALFAEFELCFSAQEYDSAAKVLLIFGGVLVAWGYLQLALNYCLRIKGRIEDNQLKATVLRRLGFCCFRLGSYTDAINYLKQSLAISKKIGDKENEGASLNILGYCYEYLGDYTKKIECNQKSLLLFQEIGDVRGMAYSLNDLGTCYRDLGEYIKAIEYYQKSLTIKWKIGETLAIGYCLGNLGNCYGDRGDYSKATDYHQKSLAILQSIGDRWGEANSLCSTASVSLFLQDFDLARKNLELAVAIWEEIDSPDLVEGYCILGITLMQLNHRKEGEAVFTKSIDVGKKILQHAESVLALEFKALALCGKALCLQDTSIAKVAYETFTKIRKVTYAKGLVGRTLKFFDLLAVLDENNILAGLKEVVAGTVESKK